MRNRNDPESIREWAREATAGVKDWETQRQMRTQAFRMIDDGKWRGDISEMWKRYFNTYELVRTGQLKDLYL